MLNVRFADVYYKRNILYSRIIIIICQLFIVDRYWHVVCDFLFLVDRKNMIENIMKHKRKELK